MNRTNEVLTTKYLEFEKMFPPFLRELDTGMCIPRIAKGWEWCFDPKVALVTEKMDGTNVKIEVNDFELQIFARSQTDKGYVPVQWNNPQYKYIIQGVINRLASRKKKFSNGVHYGEVVGLNIQGNPYHLESNYWFTFTAHKDGVQLYKDYPKSDNFEEWKDWVLGLKSLLNPEVEAEGVVFHNKVDGRMAKLRKDMFSTAYKH